MRIADQVRHKTVVKVGNTKSVRDGIPEMQVFMDLQYRGREGPVRTSHIYRLKDSCEVSGIFLSKV